MKILILTHPLETNYGGILQNFALHHVLKDMGHEVLTIDCHHDKSFAYKVMSFLSRIIRHYVLNQKHIPTHYNVHKSGKYKLKQNPELYRFITNNIQLTEYVPSYDKLKVALKYNPECIVVGSDQVWLKQYYPYTFLSFAQHISCVKIAYAASGDIEWLRSFKHLDKCKEYISSFTALSVREYQMIQKSVDFLDVRPQCVLDPVFLVDKEVYLGLTDNSEIYKNMLATYILDESPSIASFVSRIAAMKNLNIKKTYQTGVTKKMPPLEKWLSAIAYSDFIITDSFHGMSLSIIFNKQFVVIGNPKRGLDRFFTVLEKFDLMDRFVDECLLSVDTLCNLSFIDYRIVNSIIREEKKKSIEFLNNSFNILKDKYSVK